MDEDAKRKNNKPERGGQPGIYGHPLTDEKLHATSFPQADAMLRQGWTWEGELPKSSQLNTAPTVNVMAANDVADLKAKLAAAESALADAQAQVKDNKSTETEENRREAADTLERQASQARQDEARTMNEAKRVEARETLNKTSSAKKEDK
jgi:hypothetical protein